MEDNEIFSFLSLGISRSDSEPFGWTLLLLLSPLILLLLSLLLLSSLLLLLLLLLLSLLLLKTTTVFLSAWENVFHSAHSHGYCVYYIVLTPTRIF